MQREKGVWIIEKLYRFKQSARTANETLHSSMIKFGLQQSEYDSCLHKNINLQPFCICLC